MANRRMFSKSIVETDYFYEMPKSSQSLYFHLGIVADDDGFVSNVRSYTNGIKCTDGDIMALIDKGFLIPFTTGVIVITDWHIHNQLRNDRHVATKCTKEIKQLGIVDKQYHLISEINEGVRFIDAYSFSTKKQKKNTIKIIGLNNSDDYLPKKRLLGSNKMSLLGLPNGNQMATNGLPNGNQTITKDSLDQVSEGKEKEGKPIEEEQENNQGNFKSDKEIFG